MFALILCRVVERACVLPWFSSYHIGSTIPTLAICVLLHVAPIGFIGLELQLWLAQRGSPSQATVHLDGFFCLPLHRHRNLSFTSHSKDESWLCSVSSDLYRITPMFLSITAVVGHPIILRLLMRSLRNWMTSYPFTLLSGNPAFHLNWIGRPISDITERNRSILESLVLISYLKYHSDIGFSWSGWLADFTSGESFISLLWLSRAETVLADSGFGLRGNNMQATCTLYFHPTFSGLGNVRRNINSLFHVLRTHQFWPSSWKHNTM